MKILKFTLIVFVVFCINEFKAQSISGSWYSEKNNICIKFDSIDNSVVINEFFDPNVDSGKSITYKKIGDKIKLIWVGNQTAIGWEKDIYWLKIDSHTGKEITLTLEPNKHYILDEIFLEKTNVFVLTPEGCEEKWKNKK